MGFTCYDETKKNIFLIGAPCFHNKQFIKPAGVWIA